MAARIKKYTRLKLNQEVNKAKDVNELSTNAQVFFNLITLIVDIKYRQKNGNTLGRTDGKGYSIAMYRESADE